MTKKIKDLSLVEAQRICKRNRHDCESCSLLYFSFKEATMCLTQVDLESDSERITAYKERKVELL